jgi:hypothetical protein
MANNNITTANTNIATNTADIATKLNQTDYQPKIDDINTGTFVSNILSYTYDESTIYMNQLTQSIPFEANLTINSPLNNKTYKQKIIVDCLNYKGYVNVLKINGSTVEIKYLDGDQSINLSPLLGYSNIMQTLEMTRISDQWFCLSKMQLFYNSTSNIDDIDPVIYGITNPVDITVGTIYNSTDALDTVTADDNMDGALTVTVNMGAFDYNTVGAYVIVYSATDTYGNITNTNRTINVNPAPEVILYQNVSTDFLTLIPYATQLPYTGTPQSTHLSFTETGNANSWIDGDYQLNCSTEFGFAQTSIRGLVIPHGSQFYQGHATNNGHGKELNDWLSQSHGTNVVSTTSIYGNDIGTGMEYLGFTVGGNNFKHTQLASNSITYEGEWVEFKFPYQVDINSFGYSRAGNSVQAQRVPTRGVLLASNDGTTFDLLHSYNYDTEVVSINETVGNDTGKYTQFRFMFDKIGWTGSSIQQGIMLNDFKIYANKICEIP